MTEKDCTGGKCDMRNQTHDRIQLLELVNIYLR